MISLIFATSNAHKLSEIRQILPGFDIKGLQDIGIMEEIPETGSTLEENAWMKAKYLFDKTGEASLSEDTGLEVFALDGAPGVHTARYAGDDRDPERNIQKLLQEMQGMKDRSARFRTVIAYISHNETKYFEGVIKGKIALQKSGTKGFGYDPVFIPDEYNDTFADLEDRLKNSISHRAQAIKALMAYLLPSPQKVTDD